MRRRNNRAMWCRCAGQRRVGVWMLLAVAMMTGCRPCCTLFAELEERQANVVMATLAGKGIDAQKEANAEGRWRVVVAEEDFAEATVLLEQEGLPARTYQGVGEVFRKTGMVSSPSEERIRFMDALSQDLSRTLAAIEGVVEARVHIVLPENDPFAKQTRPSSAAVAIRHRWDADVTDLVPQVKGLVKNAIEGLDAQKIFVTLFRDAPPPANQPPLTASEGLSLQMARVVAWLSGAMLALSGVLCCMAGRYYRKASGSRTSEHGRE